MSIIDELVHGSIDMHVHMGPDPYRERRLDAIQLAQATKEAGMAGVVMKSHFFGTAPIVYAAAQIVQGVHLISSLALDSEVGGLNPAAVDVAGKLGSKVLWMPTFSARHDHANRTGEGITVFDENNRLLPVVDDILDLVRKYDLVLATGHLGRDESFAVIDAARAKGIEKIVYTHATSNIAGPLSIEDQVEAVRRGAFIEHCILSVMPTGQRMNPRAMAECIKSAGAAHCVLSTDFGQTQNPSPPEGMRIAVSTMLQAGISKAEIETMVKTNPAKLLGLA